MTSRAIVAAGLSQESVVVDVGLRPLHQDIMPADRLAACSRSCTKQSDGDGHDRRRRSGDEQGLEVDHDPSAVSARCAAAPWAKSAIMVFPRFRLFLACYRAAPCRWKVTSMRR